MYGKKNFFSCTILCLFIKRFDLIGNDLGLEIVLVCLLSLNNVNKNKQTMTFYRLLVIHLFAYICIIKQRKD